MHITVNTRRNNYRHFSMLLREACHQPEYREVFGTFWLWLFYQLRWFLYHHLLKKSIFRPDVKWRITIHQDDKIIGGVEVNIRSEIGLLVVTSDKEMQLPALLHIIRALKDLKKSYPQQYVIKTWNTSLFEMLINQGLEYIPQKNHYWVTLPFGPLTISWLQNTPPKRLKWLLVIRETHYIVWK